MDATKIAVVLLVLLAVIFAGGVGLGFTQKDDQPADLDVDWAKALHDWLVPDQPLSAEDIEQATPEGCFQAGVVAVPAGGTCTLKVRASTSPVRHVRWRVTAGTQVQFALQLQDSLTVRKKLAPGDTLEDLDVYREGGTLVVACLGGAGASACRLEAPPEP